MVATNTLYASVVLGRELPADVLEQLAQLFREKLEYVSNEGYAQTLWALHKIGYGDYDFYDAVLEKQLSEASSDEMVPNLFNPNSFRKTSSTADSSRELLEEAVGQINNTTPRQSNFCRPEPTYLFAELRRLPLVREDQRKRHLHWRSEWEHPQVGAEQHRDQLHSPLQSSGRHLHHLHQRHHRRERRNHTFPQLRSQEAKTNRQHRHICPFIRSIDLKLGENMLLVGTYACEIIEVQMTTQQITPCNTLLAGHWSPDRQYSNEVHLSRTHFFPDPSGLVRRFTGSAQQQRRLRAPVLKRCERRADQERRAAVQRRAMGELDLRDRLASAGSVPGRC